MPQTFPSPEQLNGADSSVIFTHYVNINLFNCIKNKNIQKKTEEQSDFSIKCRGEKIPQNLF